MSSSSAVNYWLPSPIWTEIFHHLPVHQLKQLRRVCSSWKTAVDGSPALMAKFRLRIPESFNPAGEGIVPARSVSFRGMQIWAVDPWWTSLGRCLQELELNGCRMDVGTFVEMLRQVPQLRVLKLKDVDFKRLLDVEARMDGVLEHLEVLEIASEPRVVSKLLILFESACPRLKSLEAVCWLVGEQVHRIIIDFLRKVRHSIEEIKLFFTNLLIDGITAMETMDQLKRVTFIGFVGWIEELKVLGLCHKYPNLEEFNITPRFIKYETARLVFEMLPNLKRVSIALDELAEEPLHCHSEVLEDLTLVLRQSFRDLADYRCPKLQKLQLRGFYLEIDDFLPFLDTSNHIHTLTLQRFHCREDYGIAVMLQHLPALRKLTLEAGTVHTWDDFDDTFTHPLQALELSLMVIHQKEICKIAEVFPQLEKLHLRELPAATNLVILYLCQNLTQLRVLSIVRCPIGDASTRFISQHCPALERLELTDNKNLSPNAVNALKRVHPENAIVVFKPHATTRVMVKIFLVNVAYQLACAPLTLANYLLPKVGLKPWRASFLTFRYGKEFLWKPY